MSYLFDVYLLETPLSSCNSERVAGEIFEFKDLYLNWI